MRVYERMQKIVRDRKAQNGQTQKYFAQKCGFSEKTFSMILNGRKSLTDLEIDKFCNGMGLTPNEIFGFKTNQPRAG